MQAAVYHGAGDIRLQELQQPPGGRHELIVKVHCCAICGTDMKLATVGNPRCHAPRVIGHEMVGSIVQVGEEVRGFSVGERITLATTVSCGECRICSLGLGNICPNAKPISYDFDGAFAEYIAIPKLALDGGNVIKVPDPVPDDAAALSEPLSCAVNAQEIAGVKAGDRVLILGGGPLGAIHAQLARARGADRVMIVQRSEPRLSMLRKLRDSVVIDGANEDVLERVHGYTNGLGADVVIVCAPTREAQENSIRLVRKGGSVNLFASLPKGTSEITIDSRIVHYGELRISGASDSRPEHVREAVRLIAENRIDIQAIVTHRMPLSQLHRGLELMKNKESLKILIYPGQER